jgi:hypothetical protein
MGAGASLNEKEREDTSRVLGEVLRSTQKGCFVNFAMFEDAAVRVSR